MAATRFGSAGHGFAFAKEVSYAFAQLQTKTTH